MSAPDTATAGTPFSLTITAKDRFGNIAKTFAGSLILLSSDGQKVHVTLPRRGLCQWRGYRQGDARSRRQRHADGLPWRGEGDQRPHHGPELRQASEYRREHFLDEEMKMVYGTTKVRHRLSLGIVIQASFIRATLEPPLNRAVTSAAKPVHRVNSKKRSSAMVEGGR